ncbi:unnamed protein product, partial [Rotaria socialis]
EHTFSSKPATPMPLLAPLPIETIMSTLTAE